MTATEDVTTRESIWRGAAWWVLIAVAVPAVAVLAVWSTPLVVAWLMAFDGLLEDPSGTWRYIAEPNGALGQLGLPTLGCLVVATGLGLLVVHAWRCRRGFSGRPGVRSVARVLLAVVVTVVALGMGGMIAVFGVSPSSSAVAARVATVVGVGVFELALVAAAIVAWRFAAGPREATTGTARGRSAAAPGSGREHAH